MSNSQQNQFSSNKCAFSLLCVPSFAGYFPAGRETELLPSLPRQEQGKHEEKYEEMRQVALFIYLHTDCFSRSVKNPGSDVAMSPVWVGEGRFVNKKPQQINTSQFVSKLFVILLFGHGNRPEMTDFSGRCVSAPACGQKQGERAGF